MRGVLLPHLRPHLLRLRAHSTRRLAAGIARAMTSEGGRCRVLCLHGYENSAEIMKVQFERSGWLDEFRHDADFVFVSGPFESTPPVSTIVSSFFPGLPTRQWLSSVDNTAEGVVYGGLNASLEHIADIFAREGPFDAVCGFSQGAGVAMLIAAMQEQGTILKSVSISCRPRDRRRRACMLTTHPP